MHKIYIADGKLFWFDELMNLYISEDPEHAVGNRVDRILCRVGTCLLVFLIVALIQGWI